MTRDLQVSLCLDRDLIAEAKAHRGQASAAQSGQAMAPMQFARVLRQQASRL
jgi:hypothetical protein